MKLAEGAGEPKLMHGNGLLGRLEVLPLLPVWTPARDPRARLPQEATQRNQDEESPLATIT